MVSLETYWMICRPAKTSMSNALKCCCFGNMQSNKTRILQNYGNNGSFGTLLEPLDLLDLELQCPKNLFFSLAKLFFIKNLHKPHFILLRTLNSRLQAKNSEKKRETKKNKIVNEGFHVSQMKNQEYISCIKQFYKKQQCNTQNSLF